MSDAKLRLNRRSVLKSSLALLAGEQGE